MTLYSNHFLRRAYKKGGSGLNEVVRSLPSEQFAISSASAVLTLIDTWMEAAVARYGRGNFRWVAMVGDLSAMYDEIDPALACEMAQEAIGNLPGWTGGHRRDFVNMAYAGGQVQWGEANRDSRLTVDLEQLMQMATFDCENTQTVQVSWEGESS